jgi:hypothetical protein
MGPKGPAAHPHREFEMNLSMPNSQLGVLHRIITEETKIHVLSTVLPMQFLTLLQLLPRLCCVQQRSSFVVHESEPPGMA